MKKVSMRMAGGILVINAMVVFMYSACTEGDTGKSGDSSLISFKLGARSVSEPALGTGNADWSNVKAGSVSFTQEDAHLTAAVTEVKTSDGAAAKFAKIDSVNADKPAVFNDPAELTFENDNCLAVEVTAENGENKTYYKIQIKITPPPLDPEKFHIYIAFGQSNMEGYLGPGVSGTTGWVSGRGYDTTTPQNFVVMASANTPARNPYDREMGTWYPAVPPLVRSGFGLSPADFFGRTIAEAVADQGIKVGVIVVAVGGCQIQLFAKDKDVFKNYIMAQQQWMREYAIAYVDASVGGTAVPTTDFTTEDYPYKRIVDLAKQAREAGVIKGIIMHQGESGGSIPGKNYAQSVRQIYNDLCEDLGFEQGGLPFLAGQAVGNNNGNIRSIPGAFNDLPDTAFVISSADCPPWSTATDNERIHFSYEGYEELGKRYGKKMLELVYYITE
jgi:hypothetical protein